MLYYERKVGRIMFKEKVIVVACQHLDFTPQDSDQQIKGDKVYYVRNCYDNELNRGWLGMKILQHAFLRADGNVACPEFPQFPCECDFIYTPAGRYNNLSAIEVVDKK